MHPFLLLLEDCIKHVLHVTERTITLGNISKFSVINRQFIVRFYGINSQNLISFISTWEPWTSIFRKIRSCKYVAWCVYGTLILFYLFDFCQQKTFLIKWTLFVESSIICHLTQYRDFIISQKNPNCTNLILKVWSYDILSGIALIKYLKSIMTHADTIQINHSLKEISYTVILQLHRPVFPSDYYRKVMGITFSIFFLALTQPET